jgi:hypothetical protein
LQNKFRRCRAAGYLVDSAFFTQQAAGNLPKKRLKDTGIFAGNKKYKTTYIDFSFYRLYFIF